MVKTLRGAIAALLVLAAGAACGQFPGVPGEFPTSGLTVMQTDSQMCTGWWRQASWKCEPIKVPTYIATPAVPNGNVVLISHGSQGIDMQHRWYMNALAKAGYTAIAMDHFKPRGLRVALQRAGYARTSVGNGGNALNMAIDTMAVVKWVRGQPQYADAKIGHIGESMGAGVARELTRDGMSFLLDAVLQTKTQPLDAFVGMYMGCFEKSTTDKYLNKPILLVSGTADEITPVAACRTFTKWANERGASMTLVEVPNAHHQFDSWYKLGYWGDIEVQRSCANRADTAAGVYIDDKTNKTYPYNGAGYTAHRKDCIEKGAHAGSETQAEGQGYNLWMPFFNEQLKRQ